MWIVSPLLGDLTGQIREKCQGHWKTMKWNCRKLPRQVQSSVKNLRSLPGGGGSWVPRFVVILWLFHFRYHCLRFQNGSQINTFPVICHIHLWYISRLSEGSLWYRGYWGDRGVRHGSSAARVPHGIRRLSVQDAGGGVSISHATNGDAQTDGTPTAGPDA